MGYAHIGHPVNHDAAQGHGRCHGVGIGVDDNQPALIARKKFEKL
jgi:hypothetical protein